MSPSYFNGSYANVFSVDPLNGANANNTSIGVRPVINLKADTKLTYKDKNTAGTIEDPYEVEVN